MPHFSHAMDAYRDNGFEWVAYCRKCSCENETDLKKECPGEYVRKDFVHGVKPVGDKIVDKAKEQE